MRLPFVLKKLLLIVGVLAVLWFSLFLYAYTSPVVFLHYSAEATEPVVFFFRENADTIKDTLKPGASYEFRGPHELDVGYNIEVSLPLASRDGVEIKPPFSRVDVYIGADTKIKRTVIKTDFLARFASE